jgi:hypothetical protein
VDAQLLELCLTQTGPSARFRFHELLRLFAWERAHDEDSAQDRADALEPAYGTLLTLAGSAHQLLDGAGHLPRHSARLVHELPVDAVTELLADPLEWFESERGTILALVGAAARHDDAAAHAWELTARHAAVRDAQLPGGLAAGRTGLPGERPAGRRHLRRHRHAALARLARHLPAP